MNNRTKGVACIIASAFCFALMNMFVRLSGDLPTPQKGFFRNAVALIFAVVMLVREGEGFHIGKGNLKYLAAAQRHGDHRHCGQFLCGGPFGPVGRLHAE